MVRSLGFPLVFAQDEESHRSMRTSPNLDIPPSSEGLTCAVIKDHQKPELSLLLENFDVRLSCPSCDIPIDKSNFIARRIRTNLFEGHSTPSMHASPCTGQTAAGNTTGPNIKATDPSNKFGGFLIHGTGK